MTIRFNGAAFLGVNLNEFHSSPKFPLGTCVMDPQGPPATGEGSADGTIGGRAYKYVRFTDVTSIRRWSTLCIDNGANVFNVGSDRSEDTGNVFTGVLFQETVPKSNEYGWVQVSGHVKLLASGSTIELGSFIVPHTGDNQVDLMLAGEEEQVFAVSRGDPSSANDLFDAEIIKPAL